MRPPDVVPPRGDAMVTSLPACRLWLLERPAGGADDSANGCNFAGAVVALDRTAVYLLVIISSDPARASERALHEHPDRVHLERNAFRFSTLDEALCATRRIRERFLARGWRDREDDLPRVDVDTQAS